MTNNQLLASLQDAKNTGKKKFAVLIDPDKMSMGNMDEIIELAVEAKVDYFFIGGSLIVNNMLDKCLTDIKEKCDIPTILFPGNNFQLSFRADGILFLCLISGRNPELLIGNHVLAAPYLKISPLEILPTGYILAVSTSMIEAVSSAVSVPLIVGGGISTPEKALANVKAGADVIVVGNAIEKDANLIKKIGAAIHSVNV